MTGIRRNIWTHLKDRVFRREYVAEHVKTGVAYQIKAMRDARGWSQAELAHRSGKTQSAIARVEDPDYGKFSVQTLLEMADAFDVWLTVQFVPFSEGLRRTENSSIGALNAAPFDEDCDRSAQTTAMEGTSTPPKKMSIQRDWRPAPSGDTPSISFSVAPPTIFAQ